MSKLNRLKAANFADLSAGEQAETSVSQIKTPTGQEKRRGGRPKKLAPLKRISFTLTDAQVSYLHQIVEDQVEQGLNSNISHVVRQMIQEKINQ